MAQSLYVFDMDETLVAGDCSMMWHEFLVERGIVTQAGFVEEDQRLMQLYAQGRMSMQEYLDFSIKPIEHLKMEEVQKLVDQCVQEKIRLRYFKEAKKLIKTLNQDQQKILIISASVHFLVEAVARSIGIEHAIGIDLLVENNCFTSKIYGVPSYQEGKVTRLNQWRNAQKESFDQIHFYTDSINDLALCQYADFAYLVNPCERLYEAARGQPWQILSWQV